eukprot:3233988-Prymnesium_polylepis.1
MAVTTLVEHAMARVKDSQIAERLAHEMVEGAIVAALDEEAARAKKAMQVEAANQLPQLLDKRCSQEQLQESVDAQLLYVREKTRHLGTFSREDPWPWHG